MFSALKEKFSKLERCAEASCSDQHKPGAIVYPPDRAEIGRAAWKYIHARADHVSKQSLALSGEQADRFISSESKFLESFVALYPCRNCAYEFAGICEKNPPNFSVCLGSDCDHRGHCGLGWVGKNYRKWWVDQHNAVNRDLGKREWTG